MQENLAQKSHLQVLIMINQASDGALSDQH